MLTRFEERVDYCRAVEVRPFLKWPGGKQWLSRLLAQIIRPALTNTYIEPFLGAGAAFFRICPEKSILSDINMELIECTLTVRDSPGDVLRALWRWSNTNECYSRVKRMRPVTSISAAARFIYLSRTCWGGIYRVNRQDQFNVPFGGSRRTICRKDNLMACAALLRKAEIRCEDFESIMDLAGKGDVVYADPPYTTLGQNNGFIRYNEHLFAWKDQERLAAAGKRATKRGAFVIISGLWHDSLLNLYSGWWTLRLERISRVSVKVEGRRKISEALFMSRRPVVSSWESSGYIDAKLSR